MEIKKPRTLLLYFFFSGTMLMLGGMLTSMGQGPWYRELTVPPFQPPGWVFGPVWTTLLTMLAIATWFVSRNEESEKQGLRKICLALYAVQIPLNITWSALFFTAHYPPAALFEIVFLDVVVLLMTINYWRIRPLAGLMVLPYFIWLSLATAINYWIVQHNVFYS